MRARVDKLEDALPLENVSKSRAQGLLAMTTGFAKADDHVCVINFTTTTVRGACGGDDGRTIRGWPYARANSRSTEISARTISSIRYIPGVMICGKRLPPGRAAAINNDAAGLMRTKISLDVPLYKTN